MLVANEFLCCYLETGIEFRVVAGLMVLVYAVDPRQHSSPKNYKPVPQEDPQYIESKGEQHGMTQVVTRVRVTQPGSPQQKSYIDDTSQKATYTKYSLSKDS